MVVVNYNLINMYYYLLYLLCIVYLCTLINCIDEKCLEQNKQLNRDNSFTQFTSEFSFKNETRTSIQLTWGDENKGVIIVVLSGEISAGFLSIIGPAEIYRSTDHGRTFSKITQSVDTEPLLIRKGLGLQRHPSHPNKIYIFALQVNNRMSILFFSEDFGLTWKKSSLPFALNSQLIFHNKKEKSHLVLAADSEEKKLYLSQDFGMTWKLILDSVETFAWSESSNENDPIIYATKKNESIHETSQEKLDKMLRSQLPVYSLSRSTDLGKTWNVIVGSCYGFSTKGKFLYVSITLEGEKRRLKVSTNGGNTFDAVQLPTLRSDKFYSILHMEDDMVFIHVDSDGDDGSGKLYTSDSSGIIFSLSLDQHFYSNSMEMTDFYRIESMRGTFITAIMNSDKSLTSVISFDRGGVWVPLRFNGPCYQNLKTCSLQLSSRYSLAMHIGKQLPFSTSTAVGLIIAHGHAADKLKVIEPDIYISRDGGYNWNLTLKGSHMYQIADHGGLIVAVPLSDGKSPSVVKFSTDEGRCWHVHNLTIKFTHFMGLLTEPGNKAMSVALWGYDSDKAEWKVLVIDFTKVVTRQCSADDYESWYAHNEMSHPLGKQYQGCLLGKKETYMRVKRDSMCANGYSYIRNLTAETCPCTEADFSCEYGYTRQLGNVTCVLTDLIHPLDVCIAGNREQILSTGYRKIPGDVCSGGFQPNPSRQVLLQKPCDNNKNIFAVEQVEPVSGQILTSSGNSSSVSASANTPKSHSSFWIGLGIVIIITAVIATFFIMRYQRRRDHRVLYRYSLLGEVPNDSAHINPTTHSVVQYGGVISSSDAAPIKLFPTGNQYQPFDDTDVDMLD